MKKQGGMTSKQGGQNQKRLAVTIWHVDTPDGSARLSRAISILLEGAAEANLQAEDTSKGKEGAPYGQVLTKDVTDSRGRNDSHGEG